MKPSDTDKKELEERMAKLRGGENMVVKMLRRNASTADVLKYQICQKVCWLKNEKAVGYDVLAKAMGCDVIRAKQMAHSHYDAFTLDELVNFYDKLLKSDLAKDVVANLSLLPQVG